MTTHRQTSRKFSSDAVSMDILEAIAEGPTNPAQISNRINLPTDVLSARLKKLSQMGLVKVTEESPQDEKVIPTEKGREALKAYEKAIGEIPEFREMLPQIRQKVQKCEFCGRILGLQYYFTCAVCGATYCYIHQFRHARAHAHARKVPPAHEINNQLRLVLLTSTPTTLNQAFGVDGNAAVKVARRISAQRRESIANE